MQGLQMGNGRPAEASPTCSRLSPLRPACSHGLPCSVGGGGTQGSHFYSACSWPMGARHDMTEAPRHDTAEAVLGRGVGVGHVWVLGRE